MKQLFLTIFPLVALTASAQQGSDDTVIVSKRRMDSCFGTSYHLTMSGGKYTYGELFGHNRSISKKKYEQLTKYYDCLCDSILAREIDDKYVKIYDGKNLFEEGYWHPEWMGGMYRRFYKNGRIEEEGTYTEYHSPYGPGKEIGKWTYYNKNGSIKDTVTYKPVIDSTWKPLDRSIRH